MDRAGVAKAFPFFLGASDSRATFHAISDTLSFLSVAWTMTDYDGTTQ